MPLPPSPTLNIEAFSQLFERTTNSYKYLFFLGLLDLLHQRQFKASTPIALKDIVVEMLARAWQAHYTHNLKFGSQDQIAAKLEELDHSLAKPLFRVREVSQADLRGIIRGRVDDSTVELLRYVPFRLIRPFFEEELRGAKDAVVNQKILFLAQENFETAKPLYSFSDDQQSIWLHPDWVAYIQTNFSQVQQWAFEEWVEYMERCNPGVPGIASKLPLTLLMLAVYTGGYCHLGQFTGWLDLRIAG